MKFCKNLLVTGGAGFIGSNFINYQLNKSKTINIINLDLLTYAGKIENTISFKDNKRYKFIQGDICDYNLVMEIFDKYKIDGVINFAAESHVDNSIVNPNIFIKTNILGVFNLLNIAYKNWMVSPFVKKKEFINSRFHQISTDEVYGSLSSGFANEESKYAPNSPYSSSKASSDHIVRSYNKTYGLNTVISISSNNYGPNQHFEKFIPKIIKCLLEDKEIPVYGDGSNIRDWIYVEDNCDAIFRIFSQGKIGNSYNIASGFTISNIELIDRIYRIISEKKNVRKKIKFIDDRFGHDKRYSICTKKIKKELEWTPKTNFDDAINFYINSIIKNYV